MIGRVVRTINIFEQRSNVARRVLYGFSASDRRRGQRQWRHQRATSDRRDFNEQHARSRNNKYAQCVCGGRSVRGTELRFFLIGSMFSMRYNANFA